MYKSRKSMLSIALLSMALSACGGGSSSATGTTPAATTPTTVTGQVTPTATGTPPADDNAVQITGSAINISSSSTHFTLTPNDGANINIAGDFNVIKVADGAKITSAAINGNDNNIIVGKSVTATNVSVFGQRNTIWIPEGTTLSVSNAMLVNNTIKYYKP